MFSGLSSLVIEGVMDQDGVIVVRARTAGGPVACPRCGARTGQVHGFCRRTVADVPADGRPVVVRLRVRRLRCLAAGCPVQTFREQVPGLLDRYQRRTTRVGARSPRTFRSHSVMRSASGGICPMQQQPASRSGRSWPALNGSAHASAACTLLLRYGRDVPDQVRRESSQRATTLVCPE